VDKHYLTPMLSHYVLCIKIQSTLVIGACVITANLVNGKKKKMMRTNLHQC